MTRTTDAVGRARRHSAEALLLVFVDVLLVALGVAVGPWWVLASWALAGFAAITVAFAWWPDGQRRDALHARSAVQAAGIVAIIYPTGFGAALVSAHLLGVADAVRHSGARAVRPVVLWATIWTLLAQLGVAAGWVPTRLDVTAAHAFALVGLGVLGVVAGRIERATADKQATEEEARADHARFRTLLAASNDLILVISDGVIQSQVPERSSLGHHADDVVGRRYVDLLHPDDADEVVAQVVAMMAETGSTALIEARFAHPDGHWVPMEFSCRNHLDDPTIRGFVVNARDVTERQLLQAQLEYRAFHDVLTGLANRALLRERLERLWASRTRRARPFSLLYLDLDDFKAINDSLGHEVGDEVLVEVARRLGGVLRQVDTASRLGGDEFALLLDDCATPGDAARVARRALDAVQAPMQVAGRQLQLGASIGIVSHDDGASPDELLRNADIAMYTAKRHGKARFEVFEPSMHVRAVERLQLEVDLAHALERHQLVLHYQPVVALDDSRIVGVEALLRWAHPERGLVGPVHFVPVAEASGAIVPIGRWVLLEACRQVAQWQRRTGIPDLEVAVNVSMVQLVQGDVRADVELALATSGLAPEHLTLELTESALAEEHEAVADILAGLRTLGVRIAIDDFGTGYSSLAYLQQFPVDVLKIDRSFVAGMVDGRQHPAVVRAIVELGHTLDLQTVAEGIERDSELAQFRALHCHRGQGYLFSRPADATTVEALLGPPARTGASRSVTVPAR